MKSLFEENDMEMWSTQNEGEYFVAKRFIITWGKKIQIYDFNFK